MSAAEMPDWAVIDEGLIEAALTDLPALLVDASSVKEALQENIREILIPKTGAALLEPRPEGLLNRVFLLVTPRGHVRQGDLLTALFLLEAARKG